jgi:hypothetical protein
MPTIELGPNSEKRSFRVMTFQLSFSDGARWQLIEINGVLFAVLKCRVLRKMVLVTSFARMGVLSTAFKQDMDFSYM